MSQYGRSLSLAQSFINEYDGSSPLHLYLKKRFKAHKNFGSKDRKRYADLVFSWYRTGLWKQDEPQVKLKVSALLMLLDLKYPGLLELDDFPILAECASLPDLSARMTFLANHNSMPSLSELVPLARQTQWLLSQPESLFYQVPNTWMRIWSGTAPEDLACETDQISGLKAYHIPQGVDLESYAKARRIKLEVQDFSSQIAAYEIKINKDDLVWDCCAGAGGKSLFLSDTVKVPFQLWASDVRDDILEELNRRFEDRKRKPKILHYDLFSPEVKPNAFPKSGFDVLVADVPCSGSGTWLRTPEQCSFFTSDMLNDYVQKQRTIVRNALQLLKPGGRLNYITCSCYHDENEAQIEWMCNHLPLTLQNQRFIDNRNLGADAMFFAELSKLPE